MGMPSKSLCSLRTSEESEEYSVERDDVDILERFFIDVFHTLSNARACSNAYHHHHKSQCMKRLNESTILKSKNKPNPKQVTMKTITEHTWS